MIGRYQTEEVLIRTQKRKVDRSRLFMLCYKKLNRDYKTRKSHWSSFLIWRGLLIRPEQEISATFSNQKRHPVQ